MALMALKSKHVEDSCKCTMQRNPWLLWGPRKLLWFLKAFSCQVFDAEEAFSKV